VDTDSPGRPLYVPHGSALTTLYGDVENYARSVRSVFPGTAGSVLERSNAQGFRFYARQFYDGAGKKREQYLAGPIDDPQAKRLAEETQRKVAELKEVVPHLRLLGREGFNLVDPKTYATVASLYNEGFFGAGAILIGSHAYGALLNQLGARTAPYATQDVDIARSAQLAFPDVPAKSLVETMRKSGIAFLVPELKAHATALPFLAYLLGESQDCVVLAREGCCLVRVPVPERFALHKLITSQLRAQRSQKSGKDIAQAAVLLAILAEKHPGSIEAAAKKIPKSAVKHVRTASTVARRELAAHPRAIEILDELKL
jgi:hypothetical protein